MNISLAAIGVLLPVMIGASHSGAGLLALGLVTASQAAAQEIASARYDGPTTRYPHGVLGDDIEYDTLVVRLTDGREMSARWAQDIVFEDLAPRVVDVDAIARVENAVGGVKMSSSALSAESGKVRRIGRCERATREMEIHSGDAFNPTSARRQRRRQRQN